MTQVASLVHETSTSTGSGNFTVSAVNARRRFSTVYSTGGTNVFYYSILNRDANEWEIGTGHMSAASTLVRDTVILSSNANAAVSFTAGTKDVINDLPGESLGAIVFSPMTANLDLNSFDIFDATMTDEAHFYAIERGFEVSHTEAVVSKWFRNDTPTTGNRYIAAWNWEALNDGSVTTPTRYPYAFLQVKAADETEDSEDGAFEWWIAQNGGSLQALTLGGTFDGSFAHIFDSGSTDYAPFVVMNSSAGQFGTFLTLYQNSATPAADDYVGGISFQGEDSGSNITEYGAHHTVIVDPTNASEDAKQIFLVQSGGSVLTALTLGEGSAAGGFHCFQVPTGNYYAVEAISTDAANAGSAGFSVILDSASSADGDYVGFFSTAARDSGGAFFNPTYIDSYADDITNGTEDGRLVLGIAAAGARLDALTLGVPAASEPTGNWASFGHQFSFGPEDYSALYLYNTSAGVGGPWLVAYQNSASPAVNDEPFGLQAYGESSTGNITSYGTLKWVINDKTDGSQDSKAVFQTSKDGAVLDALTLGYNAALTDVTAAWDPMFVANAGNATSPGFIFLSTGSGGFGPNLLTFYDSPAHGNDPVRYEEAWANDSAGNATAFSQDIVSVIDQTNGSEDSAHSFALLSGGALFNVLTLGGTSITTFDHIFDFGSKDGAALVLQNTSAATQGPRIVNYQNSASPAGNDVVGAWLARGNNTTPSPITYTKIEAQIVDATPTSEDGKLLFGVTTAGSNVDALVLDTTATFAVPLTVGTSRAITCGTIELGAASDTTIARSGAGTVTIEGVEIARNSTSQVHTCSSLEVGNASDTSLTRAAGGQLAVEGDNLLRATADLAAQSDMEAGTSTTKWVPPGRQHFHPSASKCWGNTTGGGSPVLAATDGAGRYNMTSITDTNTGRLTVTIANDHSGTTYTVVFGHTTTNSGTAFKIVCVNSKAAGSFEIDSASAVTPTLSDVVVGFDWATFGDL